MDNNLTKARAYFYEFLAYPLFFHEHGGKFDRWREQLAYQSRYASERGRVCEFGQI